MSSYAIWKTVPLSQRPVEETIVRNTMRDVNNPRGQWHLTVPRPPKPAWPNQKCRARSARAFGSNQRPL